MSEDIVEEIVKKLPAEKIYDDALSPVAKEVGGLGEDIAKTVRLALFPLQFAAAAHDRLRKFIDRSIRSVPAERRISPPPQILGPVLEGIRYEPEETPLDEMFSTLLSNSMDSERVNLAHPAFPQLIRQLSRDEAIVLRALTMQTYTCVYTFDINPNATGDGVEPYWINQAFEKELSFPLNDLHYPDRFEFYVDHLFHLGLAHFRKTRPDEPILGNFKRQLGTRVFKTLELQPLGRAFVEACLPESA